MENRSHFERASTSWSACVINHRQALLKENDVQLNGNLVYNFKKKSHRLSYEKEHTSEVGKGDGGEFDLNTPRERGQKLSKLS